VAVRDASEATWWRKTRQLAAIVTGAAAVLSLLALAFAAGGPSVLDLPLGTFIAIIVAPLAIMAAAFFFAGRQRRLDRDYDVAED
jgi:putative solute:sodium symporter small subunit